MGLITQMLLILSAWILLTYMLARLVGAESIGTPQPVATVRKLTKDSGDVRTHRGPPATLSLVQYNTEAFQQESVTAGFLALHPTPTPGPAAIPNSCDTQFSTKSLEGSADTFRFSESYLVDTGFTPANQINSETLLLDTSASGYFTRYAFNLRVNLETGESGVQSPVATSFSFVAANTGNNCIDEGEGGGSCPKGDVCELIDPVQINITISNVRAIYRLQRICFSTHGFNPGSSSSHASYCEMPFSYYPVDDFTAVDAACAAAGSGLFDDCEGQYACLVSPIPPGCAYGVCDSSFVNIPSLEPDLDANCGDMRDPDTGFDNNLNRACLSACCDECSSSGYVNPQYHQRWSIGPHSFAYNILGVDRILADLETYVTVTDSVTLVQSTRHVSMEDFDVGSAQVDDGPTNPGPYVRVIVNDLFAQLYGAIPDLSGGAIVVWDNTNGTGVGDNQGLVFQSSDTRTNPWEAYPNDGENLTPTQTLLGEGFGWAYVNKSTNYGPQPGAYGVAQAALVYGGRTKFGRTETCYDPAYYPQRVDLPGWEIDPTTADVPYIPSPCQMSHALNYLSQQLFLNTPQTLLWGQWFLPPNWYFPAPNWYLVGNQLVYVLRPGAVYEDLNVYPPNAFRGAVSSFVAQEDIAIQYAEVYVDVSADFSAYLGTTNNVGIDTSNSGCVYSLSDTKGGASVTVENVGMVSAEVTLTVICATSNTSRAVVSGTTGSPQFPVIPVGSTTVTNPNILFTITPSSTFDPTTEPLVVYCTANVLNYDNTSQVFATHTMPCLNADNPFAIKGAHVSNGTIILANNTFADENDTGDTGDTSTGWKLGYTLLICTFVLFVLVVFGVSIGLCVRERNKMRRLQSKLPKSKPK